jgi:glycosyltransferase involved in cell wall biosynthesis
MYGSTIILIFIIVIFLILGDMPANVTNVLTPSKLSSRPWKSWSTWEHIDSDRRFRILWIDKTYVPFVNAGNEVCTHQFNTFLLQQPYKWEVFVAVPNMPKRVYENIRCFDLYDNITFYKVLAKTNILCSHNIEWRPSVMALSKCTGIPFIGWNHTISYVEAHKSKWYHKDLIGRQFTVHNSVSIQAGLPKDAYSFVLFPPVDYRNYNVQRTNAKFVTLINVNHNKGGTVLIKLAENCPEIEFQGIRGGYDKQITTTKLSNLRYLPHTDNIKSVYETTKILIMPSLVETWGRTAVEAMSSGIPILANPTPGLKECCDYAAIYIDRDNIQGWIDTIRKLTTDTEYYNKCSTLALERSRALDPIPGLEACKDWMEKTVVKSQVAGTLPSYLEKTLMFL